MTIILACLTYGHLTAIFTRVSIQSSIISVEANIAHGHRITDATIRNDKLAIPTVSIFEEIVRDTLRANDIVGSIAKCRTFNTIGN